MAPGDQRRPRRGLIVTASDEHGRPVSGSLARWLASVAPASARGCVNVAIVPDARVRALNRTYRGKNYATDVLSFPAAESEAGRQSRRSASPSRSADAQRVERTIGDIVIARGVARRQARRVGHPETTELRVLALHGLLHLLGYDHERDNGEMARVERRLRRKGGLREGLIERP